MSGETHKRVLLVKGVANYDHLRAFTDYLRIGFEEEGCDARLLDLARGTPGAAEWASMAAFAPDLVLSFNLDGATLADPEGRPLGLGAVPLTTWMVDEPYFHPHWASLLRLPHVRTVWGNPETLAHAVAMGLPEPRMETLAGRALPRVRDEDRRLDVLFAGSIADPEAIRQRWRAQLGPGTASLLEALVEEWSADTARPIRLVFQELARRAGIADHPSLGQIEPIVCGETNRYVRGARRLAVLRAMKGLPITVVGDGWRGLLGEDSGFTFRSAVPFHLFEELASDARVTLTAQPIHAHVASERYFVSLANGSALVVNENHWLREAYDPGVEYAPYPIEQPEVARAEVERLLGDPVARRAMTEAARARTLTDHDWRARARSLLAAGSAPRADRPKRKRDRRGRSSRRASRP